MKHVAGILVILCLLAPCAVGDIIITSDGREIEGEVEEGDGIYIIKTRYGRITLKSDEVAKVISKTSPQEAYAEKLTALKLNPDKWRSADEQFELGQWCQEKRLRKEARERFEQAVALDPDHGAAHKALGHVQHLGKWVTVPQKMEAEGKVYSNGRWISGDEVSADAAPERGNSAPDPSRPTPEAGTAVTGALADGESRVVQCTKCNGTGACVVRDCMQCNGKGFCKLGSGGRSLCHYCKGSGKWYLKCCFCDGTGEHLRGRYSVPELAQKQIPHSGMMHCPKCNGTGIMEISDCTNCRGKGYRDVGEGVSLCHRCSGLGKSAFYCVFCGGGGLVKKPGSGGAAPYLGTKGSRGVR